MMTTASTETGQDDPDPSEAVSEDGANHRMESDGNVTIPRHSSSFSSRALCIDTSDNARALKLFVDSFLTGEAKLRLLRKSVRPSGASSGVVLQSASELGGYRLAVFDDDCLNGDGKCRQFRPG